MPVSFTLPLIEKKPTSVKDMVFTVLTTDYPLSIIELLNMLKRRYTVSVSFQSVRKAALQLVDAHVLVRNGRQFSINKQWILDVSKFVNHLQKQYFNEGQAVDKLAVGSNVAVYTFSRLVDSDAMWNTIIKDNFANNPDQPRAITFSSVHFWWVIATLVQETELFKDMRTHGVKSHYICYGDTPLDQWTVSFYNNIHVECKHLPKPTGFANGHNIGTYGDLIIQTTYPPKLAQKIEHFFNRYKRVEQTNLPELVEITTETHEITLTVIKDPLLAKSLRDGVTGKFH